MFSQPEEPPSEFTELANRIASLQQEIKTAAVDGVSEEQLDKMEAELASLTRRYLALFSE